MVPHATECKSPPPPLPPRVLAYSDFYSAVFSFGYIIIIFQYRSVRGPDLDIVGGGGKGAVSKVWSEYRGEGRGPSLDPPLPSVFA